MPIATAVGQGFRVYMEVLTSANIGRSDLFGQLSFTGLPSGAAVLSCHGFNSDPTAALRSSWGGLKTRYR